MVKALQLQPEIPLSNPTRHLHGLIDPTSLQGSWSPNQNCENGVINIG